MLLLLLLTVRFATLPSDTIGKGKIDGPDRDRRQIQLNRRNLFSNKEEGGGVKIKTTHNGARFEKEKKKKSLENLKMVYLSAANRIFSPSDLSF